MLKLTVNLQKDNYGSLHRRSVYRVYPRGKGKGKAEQQAKQEKLANQTLILEFKIFALQDIHLTLRSEFGTKTKVGVCSQPAHG